MLLSYWVEAQEKARRPCSPAELEQLAREVRVCDVGPAYLAFLLPSIPLFRGLRTLLPALNFYRSCNARPSISTFSAFSSPPPPSWLLAPRSRCPGPLSASLSWSLDAAQLEQLYAGKPVFSPTETYCNGFWLGMVLCHVKSDAPISKLGVFFVLRASKWPRSLSSLWNEQGCLTFSSL